jgi:RimJ/RimL family protein N-acetyltransferase
MIRTKRMTLEPAPAAFLDALQRGDRAAAQSAMQIRIGGDWFDGPRPWMQIRIRQLHEDPALASWLVHAMVLTEEENGEPVRTMVGHCGYHGAPDETGMVEIGYQVGPPYRRRGYAIEAVRGLVGNAFAHEQITRVRASISPDNEPSLALTAKLGFVRVGEQIDEIDGLEYVFELTREGG